MQDTITRIHNEFKTSTKKMLKKIKTQHLKPSQVTETDDVGFLKSIGFGNTEIVKDHINNLEKNFQETLNYENGQEFSKRVSILNSLYPEYTVVTEDTLRLICNRYELVFAHSQFYCGTIPNKNIDDLRKFNETVLIDDNNTQHIDMFVSIIDYDANSLLNTSKRFLNLQFNIFDGRIVIYTPFYFSNGDDIITPPRDEYSNYLLHSEHKPEDARLKLSDFHIAAPAKYFDFTDFLNCDVNMRIVYAKNNNILSQSKLPIEDPIILKPVYGYKYKSATSKDSKVNIEIKPLYLLATMWGIEKYDPSFNNSNPINYN